MARSTFSVSTSIFNGALAGDALDQEFLNETLAGSGDLVDGVVARLLLVATLAATGALAVDATKQSSGTTYQLAATLAATGGLSVDALRVRTLDSDDYNRANASTLGPGWNDDTDAYGTPGFGIAANAAQYFGAGAMMSNRGVNQADQWSETTLAIVGAVTDRGAGPMVRHMIGSAGPQGYFAQGNKVETRLYRCDGPARVKLGSDGPACASGDKLRLQVIGSTLTVFKNGQAIITANDATYASGRPGVWSTMINAGTLTKPFNLAVNEWWKVPRATNTQLADVYASPNPGGAQSAVMSAWSGACLDTSRRDLLIWGGGHNDYQGNEMYAFNLDNLVWRRKLYYSTATLNAEANADGSPNARHTYSTLVYDAARDKLVAGPGGTLAGGAGTAAQATWMFDCATESPNAAAPSAWTRYDDRGSTFPNLIWDANTSKYWSQGSSVLSSFNPTAGTGSQWTSEHTFEGSTISFQPPALIPGNPAKLVWTNASYASGQLWARSLSTSPFPYIGSEGSGVPATGDINVCDSNSGGIGYDANSGKLILWAGNVTGGTDNRDIYEVDPATWVITRKAGTGDVPDSPAGNGTYGRWQYLGGCGAAWKGLFMLVNTTTSDVYFYRASA